MAGRPALRDGRLELRTQLAGFAVPAAQIRGIQFPRPRIEQYPGPPLVRIFLRDGSRVTGTVPLGDQADCRFRLFGTREVQAPWNALAGFADRSQATLLVYDSLEQGTDAWRGDPQPPELSAEQPLGGKQSLKISPRRGTLLRKVPPLDAGELECSFYDPGDSADGYAWDAALQFADQRVSAVLGWQGDSYTVRSSDTLNVAVQRLRRTKGWHRLRIRFDRDGLRLQVDGQVLAHGKQPTEPLSALNVTCEAPAAGDPPPGAYLDDIKLYRRTPSSGPLTRQYEQDVVFLATGDEVYGKVDRTRSSSLFLSGPFGTVEYPLSRVQRVALGYRQPPPAVTRGQRVRVTFLSLEPTEEEGKPQPDMLTGVLKELTEEQIVLEHAWLGEVSLPWAWLVDLTPTGYGARLELEPGYHHLGNEARPELRVVEAAGPRLEVPFELRLDRLPPGTTHLSLVSDDLEGTDSRHAADLAAGHLRTQVFLNDRLLEEYLNRHVRDTRQVIRLPIPQGMLRDGKNVLRMVQKSAAGDTQQFDDCGIELIALEIDEE